MNLLENIDVLKVVQCLKNNKIKDIERYDWLIKNLHTTNVEYNREYQRIYNRFYIVRRNTSWQQIYYPLFEKEKNCEPSFESIILEIWNKTGRIEASFSSKMVATINTNMPVWDKYVLQNLHLKLVGYEKEQRLNNAIMLYDKITQYYREFLQTAEAYKAIDIFDQFLSAYKWFTPTKKIDLILWQSREKQLQ